MHHLVIRLRWKIRKRKFRPMRATTRGVALSVLCLTVSACSAGMESSRQTPVDLSQFSTGESRQQVLQELGTPAGTFVDGDGAKCDTYNLYTHGYGGAVRAPIAILEIAADVVTLGLAELALTPMEAATQADQHPVTFCYRNDQLTRFHASENPAMNVNPDD